VQGRTVIIIAHRLAALRNCDRVIALESGQIIEDGVPRELAARPDGFYGRLWRMQTANIAG
jgi:subfamily B ATP-binding cassette protein HlyB/CyaB